MQVTRDSAMEFCALIPRVLTLRASQNMQHISTQISSIIPQSRGGRVSSAELRHSIQMSEDFAGLEKDTNRYDLLVLVKRAGKAAGFTPKMIQLLDYYMAFTRDADWE